MFENKVTPHPEISLQSDHLAFFLEAELIADLEAVGQSLDHICGIQIHAFSKDPVLVATPYS